ncbi:MAG: high-affinity branched-chain amino acid ABC transporter permease LivM [Alphaproteobacteria bacterium]|nr:high-affinity branched-chain amino acid ABC transporter permease LivM [Alphaproteobacteria bacterium SS10]
MADAKAEAEFDIGELIKESAIAGLVALALTVTLIGMETASVQSKLVIEYRWAEVLVAVLLVGFARFGFGLVRAGRSMPGLIAGVTAVIIGVVLRTNFAELQAERVTDPSLGFIASRLPAVLGSGVVQAILIMGGGALAVGAVIDLYKKRRAAKPVDPKQQLGFSAPGVGGHNLQGMFAGRGLKVVGAIGILAAFVFPFFFGDNRWALNIGILILTYIMLGWGLNIVVGLAGLLDLGYVAFYAVGAYSYALLALYFDLSFWVCLPLAGVLAALGGLIMGFPVLRLRGDYFAIVTLGFGEIIRIILINWKEFTGGPDGLLSIPRPSFFGLAEFTRRPKEDGLPAFHEMFGLEFSTLHRVIFLYYLILLLALLVNFVSLRIRKLPIGRSWEALREDDIACQALGINRRNIKLAAFTISAGFGGLAGAFFATNQAFISPESFTFIESAIVLAIVVLGGMGSQTGVVVATFFVIFLPEYFRELDEYRMLMFGAAMVVIMVWKPRGLLSNREPTVRLHGRKPPPGASPSTDSPPPATGAPAPAGAA